MSKLTYRLITILTIIGALGLTVFGIVALANPVAVLPKGSSINDAATIYAQYMAVRNLTIAALLIYILIAKQMKVLGYFLLLNGIIQTGDAILGVIHSEPSNIGVPVILAILFILSASLA